MTGKSDGPGRPLLYGTSDFFMEYFGINSLNELPQLKELEQNENSIG
jgi:segregation and condensation protein B